MDDFIPKIPIDDEVEKHKFRPYLDIQNTSLDGANYHVHKEIFTPKYEIPNIQKGVIVYVSPDPEQHEYNSNIELEAEFFQNKNPPTRYKVHIYGECGKIDCEPEDKEDSESIAHLPDYYLSQNFTGTPSLRSGVYVNVQKKSIESSFEISETAGNVGSDTSPPNSKTAGSGPPKANSKPSTPEEKITGPVLVKDWNSGEELHGILYKAMKKVIPELQNDKGRTLLLAQSILENGWDGNSSRQIKAYNHWNVTAGSTWQGDIWFNPYGDKTADTATCKRLGREKNTTIGDRGKEIPACYIDQKWRKYSSHEQSVRDMWEEFMVRLFPNAGRGLINGSPEEFVEGLSKNIYGLSFFDINIKNSYLNNVKNISDRDYMKNIIKKYG